MCGSCFMDEPLEYDRENPRDLTDEDKAGLAASLAVLDLVHVVYAVGYFDEAGVDVPAPLDPSIAGWEAYETHAREALLELAEKYPTAYATAGVAALYEEWYYQEQESLAGIASEITRLLSEAFEGYDADIQVSVLG